MKNATRIAFALRAARNLCEWHQSLAAVRKSVRAGRVARGDAGRLYGIARKVKARLKRERIRRHLPPWPKVLIRVNGVPVRDRKRITARMFD